MKRMVALLLSFSLLTLLVGCGQANVADDGKTNISVILKTTAVEYWSYVEAGIKKYEQENPNVKVDVTGASSETAYDEQLNLLETHLASGKYQAIIIAPLQSSMVSSKIAEYDTPVFAIDTDIDSDKVLSFIGTGNEQAAYSGGEAAVEMAKEAGWDTIEAISIAGVQGDTTSEARTTGYENGINEAGGTFLSSELQYSNATADQAVACMEAIMQQHPDGIAIITAHSDDIAMAAASTARKNSAYANTIFVGFNGMKSACDSILADEINLSVAQNAYNMGYEAVNTCVNYLKGEQVEKFVDSGSKIITKENAQEQLDTLKEIFP